MGFAGATDKMMMGLILDGPLGNSALWCGAELIMIFAIVFKSPIGLVTFATIAALIAISYTNI
jgi:hypothetical protein